MELISGKFTLRPTMETQTMWVEHCALLDPCNQWCLEVMCRSCGNFWERLDEAYPHVEVDTKSYGILMKLPPLQEELEIAAFGNPGENGLKRMHMGIFGPKPVKGRSWMIFVYFFDATSTAFEKLYENEKRKGHKLLTTRQTLLVGNSEEAIKIDLNGLEQGWQIKGSNTKTIKSRDAWISPEDAADYPFCSFEICHVDETKQSFFCEVTASHGTNTAKGEVIAAVKQMPKEANTSQDLENEKSPHVKPASLAMKTRKKKTILWFNVAMLVLICFMEFSNDFKADVESVKSPHVKPASWKKCTEAEEMKDVCPREEMKLFCPHLEPAIKSGDCIKLLRALSDPVMKPEKQSLVHCDENIKCDRYTLEIFEERIKIRSTEQGMLAVEQLIKDDLLTFACYIERKEKTPPLVYQMNVSSSVNCLSTVAGQDVNLNQALGEIPSRITIEDIWNREDMWFWDHWSLEAIEDIKPDGEKQKIVYYGPTMCLFEYCSSSCPHCRPRLKNDGVTLMLINVGELDRGLKLECRIYPKIIGRKATQTMPQVYAPKIKDVFPSDVGHVSATFTCPHNGTLHGCLKKYRCTYVPGTEEGNVIGSAEEGLKFCMDIMCCQWKGNTVFSDIKPVCPSALFFRSVK